MATLFQYQVYAAPPTVDFVEPVLESKWHTPWSEPVRQLIVPALAIALAASGGVFPAQTLVEQTLVSKWYAPLSEPVRTLPGLSAELQRAFTITSEVPQPVATDNFAWIKSWSNPTPPKPGLDASLQQAFAISPTALNQGEAVLESKWHQPWSEPSVKNIPGLGAYLQRTFTIDATSIFRVAGVLSGYNWWSEPPREKIGFWSRLQQFIGWEPRTLPPPTIQITISATETNNDIFAGAMTFGGTSGTTVPVSAVVSIFETGDPTGSTGVWES